MCPYFFCSPDFKCTIQFTDIIIRDCVEVFQESLFHISRQFFQILGLGSFFLCSFALVLLCFSVNALVIRDILSYALIIMCIGISEHLIEFIIKCF